MNTLKKTKIFGALILFLIFAAAWFLVLSPRLGEPGVLQEQADAALSQSATLSGQVDLLTSQEESIVNAEQIAAEITKRFPANSDVPFLIEQIEGAISRSGMTREQILSVIPAKPRLLEEVVAPPPTEETPAEGEAAEEDPAAATETAPPPAPMSSARMDVQIAVKGTFTQITGFLTQLQTSERVIIVDRVRVSRLIDDNSSGETNPDGTPASQTPTEPTYQADITAHVILLPPLMGIDGTIPEAQVEVPANTVIVDEGFNDLDPNLNFDPDADPNQPEVVDPNQPEVVDPNQPEVVDPNQPEVVDPNQPQVVDPNQPQVVDPNQPQVVEPTEPESAVPTPTAVPGVIDDAPVAQ